MQKSAGMEHPQEENKSYLANQMSLENEVHNSKSKELSPNKNPQEIKKVRYEISDSSNQITNDREEPTNYRIQGIKNNTLSADTYTYNDSGEEIASLCNSLNSLESANTFSTIHKERADQFVIFFDELSKLQTKDFKDILNQKSLLLENVQNLLNIIEHYDLIIKQEEEKMILLENNNNQIKEQINEYENQNNCLKEEITTILNSQLEEEENQEIINDDFYSFVVNSFQRIINEFNYKISKNYIDKKQYEILLQQLEQAIGLLSGISNMSDESSKKTYILTQCARIGHFIDEQMHNNDIDNLNNDNFFCQFDPKVLIENFFEKMDGNATENEEEECEEDQKNESPYKEIMLFFIGINKVNELLSNKNQELIQENEELKNLLATQDSQIKDYEEWKQKQLENISLIEDTLGYPNSNSEFSLNEVSPEMIRSSPEEAIKNLIQVYNDVLSENKMLADDIRQLRKPNEMEQTFDEIKTQFISLERDFTKEKVKFDETVKELVNSIQEKDKTINEDKSVISQLMEKKQKYKEEVKQTYSSINEYQTQISDLENKVKEINEQNESIKQKSASLETSIDQLQNEKNDHQSQLEEIFDVMKGKEKKYKKKILKYKKQLIDMTKCQKENEIKFSKIVEANKKNIHIIDSKCKEISSLKANLNQLVGKIKELQTNEQLMNSKINLMIKKEEAITNEKDLIKKNSSEKIDFASKKIESMKNSLLSLMKSLFNYEPQQYNESFESLISIFSNMLIKKNSELDNLKTKCDQLNNALVNFKNENQLLKKEVDRNSSKKGRIVFEPINTTELKNWEVWAKSLCNRICHYNLSKPNDLRFAIEEAMMCSIGYNNAYQKLEFLRREKQIFLVLMNQKKAISNSPVKRISQVQSTKPILLLVIFCGRIRKITGAKAIETIITKNFSPGETSANSNLNSFFLPKTNLV